MSRGGRSFTAGAILIVLGILLLADRLDWPFPPFDHLYPFVFLALAALSATRIRGWGQREGVFGTFFFLTLGVFFILRNFDLIPYVFNAWPIWLMAAGVGCVAVFVFVPKEWGILIPGSVLLLFGGAAFLREFDFFYDMSRYWPVILIAIGLGMLVKGFRKRA
jgi:hypothetical protein